MIRVGDFEMKYLKTIRNSHQCELAITEGHLTVSVGIKMHSVTQNICRYVINVFPKYYQPNETFLNLFSSQDALHVSGVSSAHHQEHITVHTATGTVNQYCCLQLPWMRWNRLKHVQHL